MIKNGQLSLFKDIFEKEDENFRTELNRSLVEYDEKCKRDGRSEKLQLSHLKSVVSRLSLKYGEKVVFDLDRWSTRRKTNRWFLDREGVLKTKGQNIVYDTKTLDAIIDCEINGKPFTLYFILKATNGNGGHQDNVIQEVGRYTERIQLNKDDNAHFFFVLDGAYINKRLDELDVDECEKYDFSTSETIEEAIADFINKNLE